MSTRSAVVTGAGTGIGEAIFKRLIADRWYVVGVDMNADHAARQMARCFRTRC